MSDRVRRGTIKSRGKILTVHKLTDNKADYPKAFDAYMASLGLFMAALKGISDPRTKAQITEKVRAYMNRAEQLKPLVKGSS